MTFAVEIYLSCKKRKNQKLHFSKICTTCEYESVKAAVVEKQHQSWQIRFIYVNLFKFLIAVKVVIQAFLE